MKKLLKRSQSIDHLLVKQAKLNREAFGMLYNKYFEQIYIFIFKRVRDEAIAGDICQESMVKAMMNIHKYEDRGFPFSAWLYRIASNQVNLYFRDNKKTVTVEINEKDAFVLMEELTLNGNEKEQELEKMLSVLSQLKPEQTELIELRFFSHCSFQEIAAIYHISEANAKMKLYRLLKKVRKLINAS